jgi:hypothetical protein
MVRLKKMLFEFYLKKLYGAKAKDHTNKIKYGIALFFNPGTKSLTL